MRWPNQVAHKVSCWLMVRPKEKVVALSKHGKWEQGGKKGDEQREGECQGKSGRTTLAEGRWFA